VEGPGEDLDLKMGYGGAWLEYTVSPVRLLHVSVGALVVGGSVSLAFRDGAFPDASGQVQRRSRTPS
jgi:hypothetical protein